MQPATGEIEQPTGRVVTAATLTIAPEVMGRPLAEPRRRFAAMMVDICVVGLLSLLSTPLLGLGTGALLLVLLGNDTRAPFALKVARWACRGVGLALIGLSALALGHVSSVQSRELNLDILTGRAKSPALEQTIFVRPEASTAELRVANQQLQKQVGELKAEYAARGAEGKGTKFTLNFPAQPRSFRASAKMLMGSSTL